MHKKQPTTGRVHWLGAGLSTGSGLQYVAQQARHVTLWNRTQSKADQLVSHLDLGGTVTTAKLDLNTLPQHLSPGDIVVCMLPVALHPDVMQIALSARAHYISSSYVSDTVETMAQKMAQKGLSCLVEAGLDPGIDHLLAHALVADASAQLGKRQVDVTFKSYCGGMPATANDFRYKFSWAPAGVLLALANPAKWIEAGQERIIQHPWQATGSIYIGPEHFEALPNRDSVPFMQQYNFPDHWNVESFVRGTLRLDGWLAAWQDIFPTVAEGDKEKIAVLADALAAQHFYAPDDLDRVVMRVELTAKDKEKTVFSDAYVIDMVGTKTESAMARTVSCGVALGVLDTLDARPAVGLSRAVSAPEDAHRWLHQLAQWGVICHQQSADSPVAA